MKFLTVSAVFVIIFVSVKHYSVAFPKVFEGDRDWYKTSVLYQVYPRSLKDSNSDGIGDLRGVIEKLDLFVDAGVTAFWLSPIFKVSSVECKYNY